MNNTPVTVTSSTLTSRTVELMWSVPHISEVVVSERGMWSDLEAAQSRTGFR